MNSILLIDYANFKMSWIYRISKEIKQHKIDADDETINKYYNQILMEKIIKYKKQFKANKIVICKDASRSKVWRKDILQSYKENRVYIENDMSEIFRIINTKENKESLDKLFEMFGFTILYHERLEADDFIYMVSNQYGKDNKITILSNDADLVQLQMISSNVKQYAVQKNKYIQSINPKMALQEKIITGDSGDNIPSIGSIRSFQKSYINWLKENKLKNDYTDEEVIDKLFKLEENNFEKFSGFADEYKLIHKKQIYGKKNIVRMGPKTAKKVIDEGFDQWFIEKVNKHGKWLQDRYDMNCKLVDLTFIPKKYLDLYKNIELIDSCNISKRKLFLIAKKYKLDLNL